MEWVDMRLSWNKYFLNVAEIVASRSPCLKRQVGAVITSQSEFCGGPAYVLATGYNGPASGAPHCKKCARIDSPSGVNYDKCPSIHAEMNAIIQAARRGIQIDNGTLFVTTCPCMSCAKVIANSGIRIVVLPDMGSVNPIVVNYLEGNGVTVVICNEKESRRD
jgi:dCMP deaminase